MWQNLQKNPAKIRPENTNIFPYICICTNSVYVASPCEWILHTLRNTKDPVTVVTLLVSVKDWCLHTIWTERWRGTFVVGRHGTHCLWTKWRDFFLAIWPWGHRAVGSEVSAWRPSGVLHLHWWKVSMVICNNSYLYKLIILQNHTVLG